MSSKKAGKFTKSRLSLWEQNNGGDTADTKPKPKPKPKRKKKPKSKMANMWEDKLQSQKHGDPVIPKKTNPNKKTWGKPKSTNQEKTTTSNTTPITNGNHSKDTSTDTNGTTKPSKPINKFAGRAGMINLGALKPGGKLSTSLIKKREEAAKHPQELIEVEKFPRPIIEADRNPRTRPSDVLVTPPQVTVNEEINLNQYLEKNFIFDPTMLVPSKYLLLYLKEVGNIDLSVEGSPINEDDDTVKTVPTIAWNIDKLNESIESLFGNKSIKTFGYQIRLIENEK